jgi:hypothetical protein
MAARIWAEFDQIPCIFPDNREIERGDWLEIDCVHHQLTKSMT